MQNTYTLVKSPTFWLLVLMSLIPVFNAIVPTLPASAQGIAEVILGVITAYTHKNAVSAARAQGASSASY